DPGNPRNWSQTKKLYTASVSILASTVACASITSIMPAQAELGRTFQSSEVTVSLCIALYSVGLACGPFFCACSTRLAGRKVLINVSLFLLFAFLIGAAFTPTLAGLLILRFLAGLSGSISAYLPSIVLQDLWITKERTVPLMIYHAFSLLGPIIGFVLGSPIVQAGHWRWSQFLLVIFVGCSFGLMLTTSESQRRAIFHRTHGARQVAPSMRAGLDGFVKVVQSLATQPAVLLTTLYPAVSLGTTLAVLQAFTFAFREAYQVDIAKQGIVLLSMLVGLLLGTLCLFVVDTFVYRPRANAWNLGANADTESTSNMQRKLWAALPASVLAPTALFVLAWTASAAQSLAGGVIALGLFAFSLPLLQVSMVQYVTDRYRSRAREAALGGMVMVQYIIGFAFTLASYPIYSALGIGWATSVLAFIMLAFGSVPWLLY
ncbi:MFS general substrate transporter, partial [Polychaeton citri CBS 116435]